MAGSTTTAPAPATTTTTMAAPATLSTLLYGALAYIACFTSIVRLMAFLYMDSSLSRRRTTTPLAQDSAFYDSFWARDTLLLVAYSLVHSVWRKDGTKWALGRLLDPALHRSTFVLISSVSLETLMHYWTPGPLLWKLPAHFLPLHILGWVLIISSSIQMDYLELLGIQQIVYKLSGQPHPPLQYKSSSIQALYHHMRHPMLTGGMLMLWTVPVMTSDRLVFIAWFFLYQVLANRYTSRDFEYVKRQFFSKVQQFLSESSVGRGEEQ